MSKYFRFLNKRNKDSNARRIRVGITQVLAILILVGSLVWISPTGVSAAGTTFYVDGTNPACSESSSGPQGTIDVPFCTLTRGAIKAVTPGDTVIVVAGTYAETVYPNSGTAGNPITFHANPGVTVTGQPGTATVAYSGFALSNDSYVVIEGFNITQTSAKGIYADSSNHLTITNNHVSYAGTSSLFHPYEQGIYLKNTTFSTITNNVTDHNTCIGIRLLNNSDNNIVSNNISYGNFSVVETDAAGIEMTGSSHNVIINNITYSNEDTGINLYVNSAGVGSSYNLVVGNLSYENGDHGIDNNGSPYNTIIGNTVHGNGTVGINFEGETGKGSDHATVINNIIAANGFTPPTGSFGGNLRVDSASIAGTIIDYNLFNIESAATQIIWNNTNYSNLATFRTAVAGQEVHGLEGNPLFVSPVTPVLRQTGVPYVGTMTVGDYHILFGSPAIDSANSDAPSQPLNDLDGAARIDDPGTPNTGAGARSFDDRGVYEYQPSGPSLPVVTTQAVTAISATTATGNGNVTAPGSPNPTQHGVVWSNTLNPTIADNKTTNGPVGGTGAFTSAMTGLTPNTLYHVRAYATNPSGTVYGADVSFTTLLHDVTTTGVNCGAGTHNVTYGGGITCVATVTATGAPVNPSGTVSWSTNGVGNIVTSPCTLSVVAGVSSCSITYTPTSVGTGSHLITASYAGSTGFLASNGNQTVTVNKKAATVTPTAASKTYGDTDPTLTGTISGFLPADSVTATFTRAAGETVSGGPYAMSAVLSPAGVLPNYNITTAPVVFTIHKKGASVTPNAASKIYGNADPAFTGSLLGFLPADNVVANYTRTAGETVAGAPYTISAALTPSSVISNYNVTANTAPFTINKRAITVKADSKTKALGQVDPVLTYTVINGTLVNPDTFSGTLVRDPGETEGVYAIRQGTLALSNNYELLFQGATLTIQLKPAVPVTISPVGLITNASPTYIWNASTGATSYWLSVYNQSTSSYAISGMVVPASVCTGTPSICQFRPSVTLGTATYRFSVAALNSAGNSGFSPWAGWKIFTVRKLAAYSSIATQDGYILESTETSGLGGTLNLTSAVLVVGDDALKRQYRSILSFNTSSLPDNAVIVSATLKLKKQGGAGVDPFGTHGVLAVDIRNPFFGAAAGLQLDDFSAAASLNTAGTIGKTPVNGLYLSNLATSGLTYVNKAGFTQLRLRFAVDDNNNAVADYLAFYSGNMATASYRPVLEIVYYIP